MKFFACVLLVTSLTSACFNEVTGQGQGLRSGKAQLQTSLTNKTWNDNKLFSTQTSTKWECGAQCFKFGCCMTFTFVAPTLTCHVHWSVPSAVIATSAAAGASTWSYTEISGGEEWTVIQRRKDGSVDFYRPWIDYVNGFGNIPDGEYWLGLETVHALTSSGNWILRVDLGDWESNTAYATYTGFYLTDSTDNYRIWFDQGSYSGTAGDSMGGDRGAAFTTFDADHDTKSGSNCAVDHGGAWWHKNCYRTILNGQYRFSSSTQSYTGVLWYDWKGWSYSLKFTEMKIKKVQ